MIIGVVYTMAISGLSRLTQKEENLSLFTLKEYLSEQNSTVSAKIICLDECESCDLYLDGNKSKTIQSFLDDDVRTYRYEFSYGFVQKNDEVYFNAEGIDEDVCFSYELFKNGVGDQVVVEYKNKVYDFSSYFEGVKVFNSLSEAQEQRENIQSDLR